MTTNGKTTHEQCYAWAVRIGEEVGINVISLSWECEDHESCDTAHMLLAVRVKSYADARTLVLRAIAGGSSSRATLLPGAVTTGDRCLALDLLEVAIDHHHNRRKRTWTQSTRQTW